MDGFIRYFLTQAGPLAKKAGYIPLPDDAYQLAEERVQKKLTGSVFAGGSQIGVSIQDLLKKESGAAE